MSKYYCLIAGLPQIALDDSKPFYTVASFKEEIPIYLLFLWRISKRFIANSNVNKTN